MTGGTSILLWLMASVVVVLAGYVFVGWVRRAQDLPPGRGLIVPLLLAGTTLGLGLSASVVLAMSAESLAYPVGFRWRWLPGLLLAPPAVALVAALWLMRRQNWLALIGCGVLLGGTALAVQTGWVMAGGFRPGVRWNEGLLAASGLIAAGGFTAALWLAYSDTSGNGGRKSLWRAGAAVLIMLTVVAGQEVVLASASLLSQVGSIYQREASSLWLTLAFGALLPVVLGTLALDLALRNRADRQGGQPGVRLGTLKRRKRRRKYRAL